MAKSKIKEKIKDAVENILHPDHPKEVNQPLSEPAHEESSSEKTDYQMHPKFAKFKTGEKPQ